MNNSKNNRSTPRLNRKSSDFWQININNDELITRNIVNLSPEGLAFKAPQRAQFEPGQVLHLQLNVAQDHNIECEGKVVWARDQQFGLKFSRIPYVLDAFIMKAIHEVSVSREFSPVSTSAFRASQKRIEQNQLVSSTLALVMIAAMTAALVFAVFIHQQNNPDYWLNHILNKSFTKYFHNNGPGK